MKSEETSRETEPREEYKLEHGEESLLCRRHSNSGK